MRYKIEWKHQQGPWFAEAYAATAGVAWALADIIGSWSQSDRVRVLQAVLQTDSGTVLGARWSYQEVSRPEPEAGHE